MIDIIHSIVLGAVQGIAEFLPISSSGHLIIIPYLFHWKDYGLGFDVALHMGTTIAVLVYFWKDWLKIFQNAFGKKADHEFPSNFLWQILVAAIPAGILGYILDKASEKYFHSNMLLIAANLIVFGLLLWLVDKYCATNQNSKTITYKQSFLVGLAQSIALIPGVSRSGITLTASRALGLGKKEAARFSFLLATPTILGAFLLKLKDISGGDLNLAFFLGVLASTIFGFFAIKYLLKYLERGNFSVFVWYRIILAIVIITVYLIR